MTGESAMTDKKESAPVLVIGGGNATAKSAVVAKDVPPLAVVVGNPARIVKYRDKEEYYSLKNSGAARSVSRRCTRLWIPPEMQQKYHNLLQEVGYDVDGGREYFGFESRDS